MESMTYEQLIHYNGTYPRGQTYTLQWYIPQRTNLHTTMGTYPRGQTDKLYLDMRVTHQGTDLFDMMRWDSLEKAEELPPVILLHPFLQWSG